MTKAMLNLEVFELSLSTDEASAPSLQQAERMREAAFEQGYASGWQDALEHLRSEDDLRRIAAEEALQSARFTYAEAHAALQRSFMELARTMLEKLLPDVARLSLPDCVREELARIVRRNTHASIQVICAPSALVSLETITAAVADRDIELIAEPSFSEAQVALRTGRCEQVVDFSGVIQALQDHLGNYLAHLEFQETNNG